MAGLTATGFETKTQAEIETEISDGIKANVSPSITTTTDSVMGQLIKLVSDRIAALWELGQAIYGSQYPNTAEGVSLAYLAGLTGTIKLAATKTRVVATVNIDPGTYTAGDLIAHIQDRPQDRFVSVEDAVNGGGAAANVDVIFEAENTGPIEAPAGLLNTIAQAVAGWNSVTNASDETSLGRYEETDEELRIRRQNELARQGSTTADAIAADISQNVDGVLSVRVLKNDTDYTDANGLPPHSIEAIVLGPVPPSSADNTALAEQIAESKADGIQAFGTSTENVTDSQGNTTSIGYTRPSVVDIEVEVRVVTDADEYAGDAAVQAAIEEYIDSLDPGNDVIYTKVICAPLSVAGVLDVTVASTNIGLQGGALSNTNVSINIREVARITTGDITVTVA